MRVSVVKRTAILVYGIASYVMFLGVFLYAIGFLGNFATPTALDASPRVPLWAAVAINIVLLSGFALQHSGMARPAFKRWWTKFIPESTERSTYVLASNVAMIALFWLWQPIGGEVWTISTSVAAGFIYGLFAAGWATVLYATLLINHFDLFGLRQVWLYFRGMPYSPLKFCTPAIYRHVRHPLYVGWITVSWATPSMSNAHLMFASIVTVYIFVAVYFEERDLVATHGEKYARYCESTPMLIPKFMK